MSRRRPVRRLAGRAFAAALLLTPATGAGAASLPSTEPRNVADCDGALQTGAGATSLEAWDCYFDVARRHGLWQEAETRLRAHLAVDEHNAHARAALAKLLAYRPGGDPIAEFRRAAAEFAGRGDTRGEAQTRDGLFRVLVYLVRGDEADAEVERLRELAVIDPHPDNVSRWRIDAGERALALGRLAEATDHAARAEELDPQPILAARLENLRGRIAWSSNRLEDARTRFGRAAGVLRELDDGWGEADERYNEALTIGRLFGSGETTLDELFALIDRVVAVANESGNLIAEAQARLLLAQLPSIPLPRRIEEADRALQILSQFSRVRQHCFALRTTANLRLARAAPGDVEAATRLLEQATDLARERGSLQDEARAWIVRANLGPNFGHPARREGYARAVDVIEKMRDLSPDSLSRGRMMWDWELAYQRLVGAWLQDGEPRPPTEDEIDGALRVMERLRVRRTLDHLDAAGATAGAYASDDDTARQRRGILARISAVQNDLAREGTSAGEGRALSAELRRLEIEEAALREAIAVKNAAFANLRAVVPVGLDELRRHLRQDEALIAFQLSTRETDDAGKWFWNGGAWAVVVTSHDARAIPIPDADIVAERVATLLGLVRRDDDLQRQATVRLYDDLLRDALAGLPPGTRRLILLPDGALHRLPFGLLRAAEGEPPLATHYAITQAPSATLWVRWRGQPVDPGAGVLAFADPLRSGGPGAIVRESSGHTGSLPGAREEARAVARVLGTRGGGVSTGARATETAFKKALPFAGAVIHIAAHAVVDPTDPARTAVLLSPGDTGDDGLLQMREIVGLPLGGKIVLLSACSGADGEIVPGEGVVGLAGGFFQAGARAVVAGRWPVRDADARNAMVALAEGLARGATLTDALTAYSRDAIAEGLPSTAWAGWVVLGDGDVRLVARRGGGGRVVWGVGLAVTVVLLGVGLRLRSRG